MKKLLLLVLVAASVLMTGCLENEDAIPVPTECYCALG